MRSPNRTATVEVQGDGVQLAVSLWDAARVQPPVVLNAPLTVVLVHQYSKMGGCAALMRGLAAHIAARGLPVVAFDLRGVGRSTGRSTWTGAHEVKDVEAICSWVQRTLASNVLLIGSSAGAPIAGSAIERLPCIKAYVAIGYVAGWCARRLFGDHIEPMLRCDKPKLFIRGARDGFTSEEQFGELLARSAGNPELRVVPDVGHFQLETEPYDEPLAELIMEWLKRQAPRLA